MNGTLELATIAPVNPDLCRCSLTEYGIFLSSLLLSLTGIISICLVNTRKSNCTEVSLCNSCLQVKRENLDIED